MLSGSVKDGIEKNCPPPFSQALYEVSPNGPDACEMGEDHEGVSEPVIPVTSVRNPSGLNG